MDLRQKIVDTVLSGKPKAQVALIEAAGCELVYLPPCSPDLNPIEDAFAKLEGLLRKAAVRSSEVLVDAMGVALESISVGDALGFFSH